MRQVLHSSLLPEQRLAPTTLAPPQGGAFFCLSSYEFSVMVAVLWYNESAVYFSLVRMFMLHKTAGRRLAVSSSETCKENTPNESTHETKPPLRTAHRALQRVSLSPQAPQNALAAQLFKPFCRLCFFRGDKDSRLTNRFAYPIIIIKME